MTEPTTELEVFAAPGDTLTDRMRAAVQARALEELVKRAKSRVDGAVRESVEELAESAGGGGFSHRHEGWRATLTDPAPKPKIVNRDAFADWLAEQGGEVGFVDRVEVIDPEMAVEALRDVSGTESADEWAARFLQLSKALTVTTDILLPEQPIEDLVKAGDVLVTDAGVMDVATGERVPGTEVSRDKAKLQVVPDSGKKNEAVTALAKRLGLPAELVEG